jgi:hypothetical protein
MAVSANLELLSRDWANFIPERILSPTFFPLVFFDSTCEYKRDDKDKRITLIIIFESIKVYCVYCILSSFSISDWNIFANVVLPLPHLSSSAKTRLFGESFVSILLFGEIVFYD